MNWRRDLVDFALDEDTERLIAEQKTWIAAEPGAARPYYHLAQLYRLQQRREEALALLLHAVALDAAFAPTHIALSQMYAVSGDMDAARRHAARAAELGDPGAAELLARYSK
jgi:tetratricopeptide (TPR) repeat protein